MNAGLFWARIQGSFDRIQGDLCDSVLVLIDAHLQRESGIQGSVDRRQGPFNRMHGLSARIQGSFDRTQGEVGGWGRVPFSRNLMKPTPRRKWYLTTGRRFH